MVFRVSISPSAVAQAVAAYEYIAADAPLVAERWYDALLSTVDSLAKMPRRHARAREHGLIPGEFRQALHRPYRIVFQIVGDEVRVLAIRHTARDRMKRRQLRAFM